MTDLTPESPSVPKRGDDRAKYRNDDIVAAWEAAANLDITAESPAVRFHAAWTDMPAVKSLYWMTVSDDDRCAAERLTVMHERIVTERLAAIIAERDAAIAERDALRAALETPTRQMWAAAGDALVNDKKLKLKAHHDHCATLVWNAMARAAINPEAKS